jgi:TPR repeat protein
MKKILILLLTVFLSVGPLSGQEINKLDTSKILTTKQFLAKVKKQKKLILKGEFETKAEYKSKLPANPDRLMTYVDVYASQVTDPWDEKESKLNLKYDPEKELFEWSEEYSEPSLSILLGTTDTGSYAASNAMGASRIVRKVEMNWMNLVAADEDFLANRTSNSGGRIGDAEDSWSKGQGEIYKSNKSWRDEFREIRPKFVRSVSFHVPRNIAKSLSMKWVIDAPVFGYTDFQGVAATPKFSYPIEIKKNYTVIYFNYIEAYLHLINTSNGEILFTHKLWVDESLEPQYTIPKAIAKLKKSAEPLAGNKGDAEAQYKLGVIYETEKGVPQDDISAAEQSLRAGQYRLAAEQRIFMRDDDEAMKWYRLAADQGYAKAQYKLGLIYQSDKWFDRKNNIEAAKWYDLAAQQGYAKAQFNLGDMYLKGEGVPQNDVQAAKWYRLASDQGYAEAQWNLGVMYDNGRGVPKDYVQAVKWYRLAADQGDAKAQNNLGAMYVKGEGGLPQDDVQAAKWFRLAADQGVAQAQFNLGMKYSLGRGVPKNYIQAYMWLRLAADQEYEKAKWQIYFIEGRMTPEQKEEALNLARNWKSKK